MPCILLFGVGSPLVAEYEETCRRLGWEISVAVKNVEADTYCSQASVIKRVEGLTDVDRYIPFLAPLFTPGNRRFAVEQALELGLVEASAMVDPTAVIAESTQIGLGSYVNAGCVIGAQGSFGRHVIVNRASSIGHHANVAEFVSIGPGAVIAGQVSISRGSVIGAGALLLPQVTIGSNAVIGAGAIVAEDVGDNVMAMGNRKLTKWHTKGFGGKGV